MPQDQNRVEPVLDKPAVSAEPLVEPDASTSAAQEEEMACDALPSRWRRWVSHPKAPFVAASIILAGLAVVVSTKLPVPGIGNPSLVVFDPVRFVNAQRAAMSVLVTRPDADISLMLTQVAKQAEAVIKEESRGATVLIKQSVVVSELPDITDAVLLRFGLDTNVPTVRPSVGQALEDIAPTDLAFSSGKLREDYRMELQSRAAAAAQETDKTNRQSNALP